jgi:hypothetical protein
VPFIKYDNYSDTGGILEAFTSLTELNNLISSAKSLLERNNYVHIKNITFIRDKNLFYNFLSCFGESSENIDFTGIKINPEYQAATNGYLEFHTDDSILGVNQPKYTFIHILNEDPLRLTKNNIVVLDDIINYLKVYDVDFLNKLLNVKLPLLSEGVHFFDDSKQTIEINQSILYEENGLIKVAFDVDRVNYYYWKNKILQPESELKLIKDFLELINKFKRELYLEKHDILIINNQRTLHDRGQVCIELNLDGSINTREIFVGFAR